MLKKIFLYFIILFWFFVFNNNSFAGKTCTWSWCITCTWSWCINKTSFEISVNKIIPWSWGLVLKGATTSETLNKTLWTIIQRLMIWLGSLSLIIMTIGWWYMIIYHGQDELLSKWKYIFMSWIIALVVSLSSYYMVALLRSILYATT